MKMQRDQSTSRWAKIMAWLKRIGIAGFIFFLVKGIVWLAIMVGLGEWFTN